MDIKNNNFLSIEQIQDQYLNQSKQVTRPKSELSFKDILEARQKEDDRNLKLKFSKHAVNRLSEREITLSDEQVGRLNEAARKASEKGITESLVLMDSLAFIVNVPNSTVVTALDQRTAGENVFTNIDGAVLI